jgi:hypothetical protein
MFVPLRRVRSVHDWLTPLDGCPRCGYPYEREPGYFLMSIWALNYGIASVLGLIIYGVLEWFLDLPIDHLLAWVLGPVLVFSVLFARHSKALFLAFDLFFDPHEKGGSDDDGGNRPADRPPRGGGTPDKKPAEPCAPAGSMR